MRSNLWELEEAERALRAGHWQLAGRYISKALEAVRCMYCHGSLTDDKPSRPHFKGFVHLLCAEKYSGRLDYERQHQTDRRTEGEGDEFAKRFPYADERCICVHAGAGITFEVDCPQHGHVEV